VVAVGRIGGGGDSGRAAGDVVERGPLPTRRRGRTAGRGAEGRRVRALSECSQPLHHVHGPRHAVGVHEIALQLPRARWASRVVLGVRSFVVVRALLGERAFVAKSTMGGAATALWGRVAGGGGGAKERAAAAAAPRVGRTGLRRWSRGWAGSAPSPAGRRTRRSALPRTLAGPGARPAGFPSGTAPPALQPRCTCTASARCLEVAARRDRASQNCISRAARERGGGCGRGGRGRGGLVAGQRTHTACELRAQRGNQHLPAAQAAARQRLSGAGCAHSGRRRSPARFCSHNPVSWCPAPRGMAP